MINTYTTSIAYLTICLSLFVPSAHATTNSVLDGYEQDVQSTETSTNWFSDTDVLTSTGEAATALARQGVIGGYPDGEFKGWRLVNRAEISKFILRSLQEDIPSLSNNGRFGDVLEGQWYTNLVLHAANLGIVFGDDNGNTFRPADGVNTAEFLAMLVRAFALPTDVPHDYRDVSSTQWFNAYAGVAQQYNLFPERGRTLQPAKPLTRNEVAYALFTLLKQLGHYDATTIHSPDLGFTISMPGSVSRFSSVAPTQTLDGQTYIARYEVYDLPDRGLTIMHVPDEIEFTGANEEILLMLQVIASQAAFELEEYSVELINGYPGARIKGTAIEREQRIPVEGYVLFTKRQMFAPIIFSSTRNYQSFLESLNVTGEVPALAGQNLIKEERQQSSISPRRAKQSSTSSVASIADEETSPSVTLKPSRNSNPSSSPDVSGWSLYTIPEWYVSFIAPEGQLVEQGYEWSFLLDVDEYESAQFVVNSSEYQQKFSLIAQEYTYTDGTNIDPQHVTDIVMDTFALQYDNSTIEDQKAVRNGERTEYALQFTIQVNGNYAGRLDCYAHVRENMLYIFIAQNVGNVEDRLRFLESFEYLE